jgi:hypothetical protein
MNTVTAFSQGSLCAFLRPSGPVSVRYPALSNSSNSIPLEIAIHPARSSWLGRCCGGGQRLLIGQVISVIAAFVQYLLKLRNLSDTWKIVILAC